MATPARRRATYEDLLGVPDDRIAEGMRRDGERWLLPGTHTDDAVVQAEPFEAMELDLLLLWDEQRA